MTSDPANYDLVILGASVAGVELLHQLRRSDWGRALKVAVVDRRQRHPYIPLVHEGLGTRPIRSVDTAAFVAAFPAWTFVHAEVTAFDPEQRQVTVRDIAGQHRQLQGESVVIALGSVTTPPAKLALEGLLPLKFDDEADAVLARIRALGHKAPTAVIGGGISGVELAGELRILRPDAPVALIQGGPRLLPRQRPNVGAAAKRHLEQSGVEVLLNHRVEDYRQPYLNLRGPRGSFEHRAALAFWCGGISPAPMLAKLGLPLDERGWLRTLPTLEAAPNIFVIGDAAAIYDSAEATTPWPTMKRAIEALWGAWTVADNLKRRRRNQTLRAHRLHEDFFHGISIGHQSMVVYGPLHLELGVAGQAFRRFLMNAYAARYAVPR